MLLLPLLGFVVLSDIEQRDITLTNRKPGRVVQILTKALGPTGSLIPTKVAATPDDPNKKVHLRGETALLDTLAQKLAFFDQPRTKIVAQATMRSRLDKVKNDYMLELENGSDWRMTDSDVNATVRLWPLILEKGKLRIYAAFIAANGQVTRTVTELTAGETLVLRSGAFSLIKALAGDVSGMNLTWTTIPPLGKEAARWYITEGPDPVPGGTTIGAVDALEDPLFSATFKIVPPPASGSRAQ